ncbi:MAG: diguanylate cyclase [Pirellulales bacterium]
MVELPFALPGIVALALVAAIGYWIGRRQATGRQREMEQARREMRRAQAVARELETISDAIRQSLSSHQSSIVKFKDRVSQLGAGAGQAAWEDLNREIEQVLGPTQRLTAQLAQAYQDLRQQADQLLTFTEVRTDPLTGVSNRRALEETLTSMFSLFERYETPFSLLILDVDKFKEINDTRGHQQGDQTLKSVAAAIDETVRETDVVARFGGDEFVVLMPQTHLDQAALLAERLRAAVRTHADVGISTGVAAALDGDSPRSLLARADEALFAAKAGGRNCTYWHDGKETEPAEDRAIALA